MSRIFDLGNSIINGLFIKNQKEVKDAFFSVIFDWLEPAFRSLRKLRRESDHKKISERERQQDIENIYVYLKIAIKDRFAQVAKLMGYDIWFLFQKEEEFNKKKKDFLTKNQNIDPSFISMIEDDRKAWLNIMMDVKNLAIEHAGDKNPKIVKDLKRFLNLEAVEKMFENCWKSIEDITYFLIKGKINPRMGMCLGELPEYQKDKNFKHRFGWYVKKVDS